MESLDTSEYFTLALNMKSFKYTNLSIRDMEDEYLINRRAKKRASVEYGY